MTKDAVRRVLVANRALASCRSVAALLESLKRILGEFFPTASGYAVVFAPHLPGVASIGFGRNALEVQSVASRLAKLETTLAARSVSQLQTDQVRSLFSHQVRFAALGQIFDGNDRVGCLVISLEAPNSPEIELVDLLTELTGVHLQNAILNDLAAERLHRFADCDTDLTDLPNRTSFRRRLGEAVSGTRSGEQLSVGFVDLDNFNRVNRSIGHFAADQLLRQIAERWSRIITLNSPETTLARVGGDEFGLIFPGCLDGEAATLVSLLLESLRMPMRVDDHEFTILASAGICSFPRDAQSIEAVLKAAEKAMFCAKDSGGNRYRLFSELAGDA
jgi:diguanylate cyclase (GGDEF)-like protein